ncbi:CBS domain-containing protein [Mesorhizobium jarvisii]|uniref:CBS domain-containing protein n=1 Tax=Mesorhizobium jarvisii TaxID=1777867 RepID=UPI001F0A882A|nr:CBS domain-containing protein [Mesorhizobium jarvisii]MCH4559181.1 CBS domain-containing protein [Mesorhizobium jarvisii]
MKASDIMTMGATTVRPDTTIEHAARVMLEHRISGLPVVNAQGKLLGIVTERDLLRREEIGTERHRPRWLEVWLSARQLAQEYSQEHGRKVEHVMSRDVASVGPDTPVGEIVDLMEERGIKRLPVVSDGKVVGIVSRTNLLLALSRHPGEIPSSVVSDLAIRKSIVNEVESKAWTHGAAIDVNVRDGVVNLNGTVTDEKVRTAVRIAAENTPGAIRVVDNLRVVTLSRG